VSVCHASFVPFCARMRQVGDPPGAVLGDAAPCQGPVGLAAVALCCEDKNPPKTDAPN
jgi:hypothetical protein